jgi:hypothetical protein
MLTSKADIKERLVEGCDTGYFDSVYAQMNYAFGEPWKGSWSGSLTSGMLPFYPSITCRSKEVGRSMRIMSAALIDMARVMFTTPEPYFPDVQPAISEVRKQFWLSRYLGTGDSLHPEWSSEFERAYMDTMQLGAGYVQHGVRTNPSTSLQYSSCRYSPLIQTLTDRQEVNPSMFRWIAFVRYYAPDVAKALYPKLDVAKYTNDVTADSILNSYKVVRVIEYYDLGMGSGQPTRAIIPDDVTNEPIEVTENPFGCLPFSYGTNVVLPGMDRPIGRIVMQVAAQEARNELERKLRRISCKTGAILIQSDKADEKDVRNYMKGISDIIRTQPPGPDGRPVVDKLPDPEVSQTTLQFIGLLDRELNADSGTTDFDRGTNPTQGRTLGENQLVDARSASPKAWARLQAQRLFTRAIDKTFTIARQYDTDPVTIDVYGDNINLNDPSIPASSISGFLEEPSKIVLDAAAFEIGDADTKMLRKLQLLDQFGPLIGTVIDPVKVAEEKLKAMNKDPKDGWLLGQQVVEGAMQGTAPNPNIASTENA